MQIYKNPLPEPVIPFSPKKYICYRAEEPVEINGIVDKKVWAQAPWTDDFIDISGSMQSVPRLKTRAKMLWDEQYLYIAAELEETQLWATLTERESWLFTENDFELFIDPDGDSQNYMEIEVNPLKAVMDLTIDHELGKAVDGKKGNANYDWDLTGLKIGVTVDGTLNNQKEIDKRWICELAFPFKEMAFSAPGMSFPPKPGDSWRLNLYRYDYGRDDAGNTPGKLQELTAWNQTDKRGFHAPDKFGKLIFSKQVSRMPKP